MRTRQRLVRALITEIIADVDTAAGEIVLVILAKAYGPIRPRKFVPARPGQGALRAAFRT
jgi:hypothetical protein